MKFDLLLTDQAVLREIGDRIAHARLERNQTQAELAEEAGIGKRTLERIEAGESSQLTNFLRLLRELDLLDRLELLLPPPEPSPLELLRNRGKERKRASGSRGKGGANKVAEEPWTWDD
jgi:transcriptional regulator with XRE-family HTH domain